MEKEQTKRYLKVDSETTIKTKTKTKKELSNKSKISILVVTGILALASIIGVVILLSKLLNNA